jgi:hypothetical protein
MVNGLWMGSVLYPMSVPMTARRFQTSSSKAYRKQANTKSNVRPNESFHCPALLPADVPKRESPRIRNIHPPASIGTSPQLLKNGIDGSQTRFVVEELVRIGVSLTADRVRAHGAPKTPKPMFGNDLKSDFCYSPEYKK